MSTEIFKVGDPVFDMHLKWCTVLKPGYEMTEAVDLDNTTVPVPNETLSFTEYDLISGGWSQDRSVLNQPKKGDLVYVRDFPEEEWKMYLFSHIGEGGGFYCFADQFKAEGGTNPWHIMEVENPLLKNK